MKKKIIKYVLIIVLITILLVITNYVRNYIILTNLKEKISKLKTIENFSHTIKQQDKNIRITKSGDIVKIEQSDLIIYINTTSEERIQEDLNTGERTFYPSGTAYISLAKLDLEYEFKEALFSNIIIMTKTINNEKCYRIKIPYLKTTFYVSAETGLVLGAIDNDKEIGSTGEMVYYEYQLENIEKIDFESLKNGAKQVDE